MAPLPDGPTAWQLLRPWPAWRGLEENLTELARLLRHAGDDGAGLAEQIELLLADPEYAAAGYPAAYRFHCALTRSGRPTPTADDADFDLSTRLLELARQTADAAVMLEAAAAAWQIGQTLTVDLPRTWQARLTPLLFQLRQAGRRGARGESSPPAAAPAPAPSLQPLPTTGWWQLHHVVPAPEGCAVVLPAAAPAAEQVGARLELLWLLLRDFGLDLARLHLALLAGGGEPVPQSAVFAALGLNRRGGLSPLARTGRALGALNRLTRLRVSVLAFAPAEQLLEYRRETAALWEGETREFGQSLLLERDGRIATHGADWSWSPRPESWAPHAGLTALAAGLLTHHDDLSFIYGVLLAFARREGGGVGAVAIPNWVVLQLAGLGAAPGDRAAQARLWRLLRTAARRHGSDVDFSSWPTEMGRCISHSEGDAASPEAWRGFLDANVIFTAEK